MKILMTRKQAKTVKIKFGKKLDKQKKINFVKNRI